MKFVHVDTFFSYIDAHIILGRLEEEGIKGWLKDEHTATLIPAFAPSLGGIMLMIPEPQAERAIELLQKWKSG